MKIGSAVHIISGTHKDMEGKIVAITDSKAKDQTVMGDRTEEDDIDDETYVQVELKING